MQRRIVTSLHEVEAAAWNRLDAAGSPFLRHEFLLALEESGCAAPSSGWHPQHLLLYEGSRLVAAMPLYLRDDSWGEFVFDWGWARAYHQAGLHYYPKLTSAVPFTPATGARLLVEPHREAQPLRSALAEAAVELAADLDVSSLHVLFPTSEEIDVLTAAGLLQRHDCQFHWHNRGYEDFDQFLGTFSSAKRKKVRRERKRVLEGGITHRVLHGAEMTPELWHTVCELTARTFLLRGRAPYLSRDFFERIGTSLGEQVVVVLAEHSGLAIAAAVCLRGRDVLYGRYWGSLDDFHSLHFETCYYQGIEYCIHEGLARFEPGTQGEHKLARGFEPRVVHSAHWLADSKLHPALGRFLAEERRHVQLYMAEAAEHTPYRREP